MKLLIGACLLCVCWTVEAGTAPDENYNTANTGIGDKLQIGLPLLSLALSLLIKPAEKPAQDTDSGTASGFGEEDRGLSERVFAWNQMSGTPWHDFVLAFGRTEVATTGLKYGVNEKRPNGGDHSFPSGHTSASFVGAEFIRKEYGGWYGAPAYLAASYVGWTRQQSRNHYSRDVIAGAAIGILSNHDLSELHTPYGELNVGVSLLANEADLSGADQGLRLDDHRQQASSPLVPGLRIQWQF